MMYEDKELEGFTGRMITKDSDSDLELYSQEYLDGLLEKAQEAARAGEPDAQLEEHEEEVIFLEKEEEDAYVLS